MTQPRKPVKVSAVISLPRLAFTDNMFCANACFGSLGIPIHRHSGAFWEQSLSILLKHCVDAGDEFICILDYDSVFDRDQFLELLRLIETDSTVDAVFPVQIKRTTCEAMLTPRPELPLDPAQPISPVLGGHFGLTLLRTSALKKMPQPWFWSTPNEEGMWEKGPQRYDADTSFWVMFDKMGFKACQANHVRIGHIQMIVTFPANDGRVIHMYPDDFARLGVPKECKD